MGNTARNNVTINSIKVGNSRIFLINNKNLIIDTAFFTPNFTAQVISKIDNFDAVCDGLLINSENFQALNFNATTYNDREFVLTDVEILDGQIALSGNSTYSDEIYMEDVYFNEDAISSSLRLLGNNIDTVVFNRKRTGGFIVAQYFAGAKELNLSQAAYYEISINANGGDIRLLKPWDPATIGSNIELFDEFKLNFISGANFTNGTDFTFEKTYEARKGGSLPPTSPS